MCIRDRSITIKKETKEIGIHASNTAMADKTFQCFPMAGVGKKREMTQTRQNRPVRSMSILN